MLPIVGDSILHAGREYTFSVRCADVEHDSVAIRLSWGDGDTSGWSHFAESGDTILLSHTWALAGYRVVEAQSKDRHGAAADWLCRKEVRVLDTAVVKWIVSVGGFYWTDPACPAIAEDGTIYVGCADGLHALSPDGDERWSYPMNGATSPVVGQDGTIYVNEAGTYWGPLRALTPSGTQLWHCHHDGLMYPPALGTDGTIYSAACESLFAFKSNGDIKWIALLPSGAASGPVVAADGTVYVGSYVNRWDSCAIYAFDPDGSPKWHAVVDSRLNTSVSLGLAVADDGTIRYSCSSKVGCVNPDGTSQWTTTLYAMSGGQPSVDPSGVMYPVSWPSSGDYAINPDGSVRWHVTLGGVATTPAIGADSRLWLIGGPFHGRLDSLYHVNADGSVQWEMAVRHGYGVTPPTIGPDGTVYVGMGDSCLYALRGSSLLAASGWPKSQHDVRNTGCAATPNGGYGPERRVTAWHDAGEEP